MTPARPLVLVASSGLAREVAAAVELLEGYDLLGCIDDDETLWGTKVGDLQVLGGLDSLATEFASAAVVLCSGKGATRRAIAQRLDVGMERYATVVHPSVHVPRNCEVGAGSVLLAHVAVTADVRIGCHVVVMPNCTLTHDNVVENYATLTSGVSLAGGARIGEAAYVGMNASVREGVTVAPDSILGMGSVLITDSGPRETWFGAPARRREVGGS